MINSIGQEIDICCEGGWRKGENHTGWTISRVETAYYSCSLILPDYVRSHATSVAYPNPQHNDSQPNRIPLCILYICNTIFCVYIMFRQGKCDSILIAKSNNCKKVQLTKHSFVLFHFSQMSAWPWLSYAYIHQNLVACFNEFSTCEKHPLFRDHPLS